MTIEERREKCHIYYTIHKKEILARAKRRYKNKKHEILAKHKEWIKHNRQKVREIAKKGQRRYYWRHRKEIIKQNKNKYSEPERRTAILEAQKRLRERSKTYVLKKYGGKCAFCGIDEKAVLSIDHINNDGYKDRQLSRKLGVHNQYEILKRDLQNEIKRDDLQVLCMNCQFRKKIYGGKNPNLWDKNKVFFLSQVPLPVFIKCRQYGSGKELK
jgi:hypothetical protein